MSFLLNPFIFPAASTEPLISTAGLKFYQKMNNDIVDSSPFNYSVPTSNITFTENGKFGYAGEFDGSSKYEFLPNENYNVATGYTIMAWIKKLGTNGIYSIFQNDKSQVPRVRVWQFRLEPTSSAVGLVRFNSTGGVISVCISTTCITDSNWHHVAFTFDNAVGTQIYIDGVADTGGKDTVKTNNGSLTSQPSVGCMRGGTSGAPTDYFNGYLDEVILYTRPLSAAEIATVAAGTGPLIP